MDAISCLAPAAYDLSGSAAIERALHFSMSDSPSASASSSSSTPSNLFACGFGFAAATAPHPMATCCDSVLVADSGARPPATKRQLGPAAGRAGKRRARASKRAPTTYISTDPANFRLMVQHVTGVQAELAADGTLPATAPFDASTVLLDAPPFAALGVDDALLPCNDAALHHHLHQQQQPCFPTLDSWSVMYESRELL